MAVSLISDTAKWMQDIDGVWVAFRATRADAERSIREMGDGKAHEITIKAHRKRRSLDANAYFWVLADRLAEKLNLPKTEIYRGYIHEVGGNSETVCVVEAAADKLCQGWSHNGLGWVAEKVPSKLPGCVNVVLYYGSSTYDTAQMSRLIHLAVEDCKALGIETMTPAELARLLEGWE